MNRRRAGVTATAVLVAMSLAACNRAPAAGGGGGEGGCSGIRVGLAVANLQADFFNQIKQSVDAEAKKLGMKVQVSDAGGDSSTQVNQIQDFISRQVQAIIYIPAGATAASVPVKAAERANIPVVAGGRNAPHAPAETLIPADNLGAGPGLRGWGGEENR